MTTTATTTAFVTRCRDGLEKTSPAVRAVYDYGLFATFALMLGYTALPRRIDFVCPACGAVFGSITDRNTLAKFRYHEPRIGDQ